jgi:prolipoprotein diacylglyceryltransferase
MEFTLLAAAALGVAGVHVALWWEARRGNAADCTADLWDIALGAIIAGVFIGRLAAMIGAGVNPLTHPGDILIVRAGVATGWATLAALATIAWLGRRELPAVFDGLAVAALAGLAGWHAGCLPRQACLGTPTDLPWAVHLTGSEVGRHPVELYAALAFLLAGIGLALWRAHGQPPRGVPASMALLVAGTVRLATEPMRPSLGGGPIGWYVVSIALGIAGVVVAFTASKRAGGHNRRGGDPGPNGSGILGGRDFIA